MSAILLRGAFASSVCAVGDFDDATGSLAGKASGLAVPPTGSNRLMLGPFPAGERTRGLRFRPAKENEPVRILSIQARWVRMFKARKVCGARVPDEHTRCARAATNVRCDKRRNNANLCLFHPDCNRWSWVLTKVSRIRLRSSNGFGSRTVDAASQVASPPVRNFTSP